MATSSSNCNWTIVLVLVLLTVNCIVIILSLNPSFGRDAAHSTSTKLRDMVCGDSSVITTTYIENDDDVQQQSLKIPGGKGFPSAELKNTNQQQPQPKPSNSLPVVFEGVEARAFDPWPKNKPLPCFETEPEYWKMSVQQLPAQEGFVFLKSYKTGSSTASGINLRIARNVARRLNKNYPICKARFDHQWASSKYSNLNPDNTFFWTIVRDPSKRIVSQFFHFEVSRKKIEPSDSNFINFVRTNKLSHDYYLSAFSLTGYKPGQDDPTQIANKVMDAYNFIAITERMSESIVALSMLLGIPIADVLYLAAKGHGGYDDGGGRGQARICTYIWPSFVSEGMQTFLDSEEWHAMSHWDRVVYQAANRSLDLTIDQLGRDEFEKKLASYENALTVAHDRCLHKTVFPCSSGGKFTPYNGTDCLWNDSGCNMDCLDEVATDLDIW